MLSSIGRAAIRRVGAGAPQQPTKRVLQSLWQLERADNFNNADFLSTSRPFCLPLRRFYATAVKATKPKTKASSAAKTKTMPKTKKAAPKKSVKKAVKKKPKKKVAKKPKKKVLTEEQKKRAAVRALKVTALTPPTHKPNSAWLVFLSKLVKDNKSSPLSGIAKEASISFKAITTEELEALNHIANQNKKENEIEYKKWIESHKPDEIRIANNARRQLKRTTPKGSSKYPPLRDARLPKRARKAWIIFLESRWNSGDFKGVSIVDAGKRVLQEWKELSPSERQPFENQEAAQRRQYAQEFKTVFGREPSKMVR